jgi:N-acetylmuramate 1-kinase
MHDETPRATDERLELLSRWLARVLPGRTLRLAPASADASFRRYFRVWDGPQTWVAMDAPPANEDIRPFVRVARALAAAGLSVPRIHEADEGSGFLLLSDLGETHYLAALRAGCPPEGLYPAAARALCRMQTTAALHDGLGAYDAPFMAREVSLFPTWFLARHLELEPAPSLLSLLERALSVMTAAAAAQPQVFVHRDYHSRNLMVVPEAGPGIIDFQDAILGPVTYDLASIYKDCYIRWPRDTVLGWVEDYRSDAIAAGLRLPSRVEFVRWFDLVGLQRHLKVLGIFARLWYRDGKPAYLADLPLVLEYVRETTAMYAELAELDDFIAAEVLPRFAAAQARAGA